MSESSKPRAKKVGDVVEAKHVVRPDGTEHDVSGGSYVLDEVGAYVVDGNDLEVKA